MRKNAGNDRNVVVSIFCLSNGRYWKAIAAVINTALQYASAFLTDRNFHTSLYIYKQDRRLAITALQMEWKGINRKQSTRWQHLSRLKASAFFSLQKILVVMKHSNLYLGRVLPSGGWQSLITLLG